MKTVFGVLLGLAFAAEAGAAVHYFHWDKPHHGNRGNVTALDLSTGKVVWEARTQSHATPHWKISPASRCELDLRPCSPGLVTRIYVSPLAQGGSLLRFRAETTEGNLTSVQERLEKAARSVPVSGEIFAGKLRNGLPFVDVLVSLHLVLATAKDADDQEERLFSQVTPLLDTLVADDT